jgi:predicted aminopeptidase
MHASDRCRTGWTTRQTRPELRQRLELAQRIRDFASASLALPDNASYRRYADLGRRAAVYNVVAAGEFSLDLKTWCFPVAGCVGYRGYYNEAAARRFAATLPADLEVLVYPVPAYSTLGWLNWAGGDPCSTPSSATRKASWRGCIIHELAHQVLYVKGDTMFNESFATAVERLGGARWLAQQASEGAEEYRRLDQRRQDFRALTRSVRERLSVVSATPRLQRTAAGRPRPRSWSGFGRVRRAAGKLGWLRGL